MGNEYTSSMYNHGYSSTGNKSEYMMNSGLGIGLTGFIVIFTFVWVILYSFRPSFVRKIESGETVPEDDAESDPARTFVASLIITLLLLVIFWMFWSCR